MRFLINTFTTLLSINRSNSYVALPKNHPLASFSDMMHCPYASDWLRKGPEQAMKDLQIQHGHDLFHQRNLQEVAAPAVASCNYKDSFTNSDSCVEFRGSNWDVPAMEARCNEENSSSLTQDASCDAITEGGWCIFDIDENKKEAMRLVVNPSAGCEMLKTVCTTFAGGDLFQPQGTCVTDDTTEEESSSNNGGGFPSPDASSFSNETCQLAPGPIGAAHQLGYSSGYRFDCPGMPAESSPYQWPLRWSADSMQQSIKYNTDTVSYLSEGKLWYMLDKNWKRMDGYKQVGEVPFFLRSTEEETFINSTKRRTIIHRGPKMIFIEYNDISTGDDVADIANCTYLELGVVGNIRPDWFLDDVGSSTDAQYLGNQHVYYHDMGPRLVKQWRKTDFADMYFTMSMKENLGEDQIHWPLILNVPGEGFGDDMLRLHKNFKLLTDEDIPTFLIDEEYERRGGTCVKRERTNEDGSEGGGPPGDMEKLPSNLEIEGNGFIKNVITFSPVWVAETDEDKIPKPPTPGAPPSPLVKVGSNAHAASCYVADSNTFKVEIKYDINGDEDVTPWLALSFRDSKTCAMHPSGGAYESVLVLTDAESGELSPYQYFVGATTRSLFNAENSELDIVPLSETTGYSNVEVKKAPAGDFVTLIFEKDIGDEFDIDIPMQLTYAIGTSDQFGYHAIRECFEISTTPECPQPKPEVVEEAATATVNGNLNEIKSSAFRFKTIISVVVSVLTSTLLLVRF